MTIGERLRKLRESQGVSQRQLGERVGLSYAYISRVESGDRRASRRSLDRIAEELGVTGLFLEEGAGERLCPHCDTHLTVSRDGSSTPRL